MRTKQQEEIAQRWVAALRSGEYNQGKGLLHSESDKFCCLGVLCDLAVKEGVIPPPVLPVGGNAYKYGADRDAELVPRTGVMEWSGLRTDSGQFEIANEGKALSVLNDKGESFSTIADIIESNPPGLFS